MKEIIKFQLDGGNFKSIDIKAEVTFKDSNRVEYYEVECKKCNLKYKVYEREYHFLWWEWQRM